MRPEKQLQCIQCGGSNFPLDISESPSSLYVYDARLYHWNFLDDHFNYQDTHWSYSQFIRGGIPPRTIFPFVPHSRGSKLGSSVIIHQSSDYLCSRLRPKAQYIIWAFNPIINITLGLKKKNIYIYIYPPKKSIV